MSTQRPKSYLSHAERTAQQPRDPSLHTVSLASIQTVANNSVRLLRLRVDDEDRGIKFKPGQWLDVHVPDLPKPGGFTITSPPLTTPPVSLQPAEQRRRYSALFDGFKNKEPNQENELPEYPFLDLAVQCSPKNPPAVWLWQDTKEILNAELYVRVGGEFTWPPSVSKVPVEKLERAVFLAGGVGINPLMAMLADMYARKEGWPKQGVRLLYGHKISNAANISKDLESQVLFLERLRKIAARSEGSLQLQIFLTSKEDVDADSDAKSEHHAFEQLYHRRMTIGDVEACLPKDTDSRKKSIALMCGPQAMTDEFVAGISELEGMSSDRVLCEKWW